METKINPNQINSNPIKILNVVETGSLTRNGAIYSGFSNSNYLQFGDKVNGGGYFSSDNNVKDFGAAIQNSTNWEFVIKVQTASNDVNYDGMLLSQREYTNCLQFFIDSKHICGQIGNEHFPTGVTTLSSNTYYFFKLIYNGTQYICYSSLTGEFSGEEILEFTANIATKPSSRQFYIGTYENEGYSSNIDISGCYIKINGEYWWKGVETL